MHQPAVRCVEFVESVTDWMEGALVDPARLAIEEHLVICPHCTEYVAQLRLSMSLLRTAESVAATEAPAPAARAALLEAYRKRPRDGD